MTMPGINEYMENKYTGMIANNLTTAHPSHLGEIIKDELEARGSSQRKLAEDMGIRYTVLNEILNGHRPLTEKTALLFEAALGIDSEPLMRMQTKYRKADFPGTVQSTYPPFPILKSIYMEMEEINTKYLCILY